MVIEKLEWDSVFFELKIGKLMIADDNVFNPHIFKEQAYDENFDLVYVFKYQTMLDSERIKVADLHLVDIQMTMLKEFNKKSYFNVIYDLKTKLTDKELWDCYQIAEDTSIVSRFYRERIIGPKKTKELYRKWIDNAINKSYSNWIFIEKESNSVIGIHLIRTDQNSKVGYFTLTGVNPKYKRMGIGRKLWIQSFGYFSNNTEVEIIKSPFSFQNAESFNFHLKMGFTKVEEIKYIYHFRNNYK